MSLEHYCALSSIGTMRDKAMDAGWPYHIREPYKRKALEMNQEYCRKHFEIQTFTLLGNKAEEETIKKTD